MIQEIYNVTISTPSLAMLALGMIKHTSVQLMAVSYKPLKFCLYLDAAIKPSSHDTLKNIQLFKQLERRTVTYLAGQ